MIVVLNFGSQVAHLICRRVRELNVRCEVVPHTISASELSRLKPNGIILSGGPASVYETGAPKMDHRILDLAIPVLGICYGHQLIAKNMRGKVSQGLIKEYGKKVLDVKKKSVLLEGLAKKEDVWMSHGDAVIELPEEFEVVGSTDSCKIAAFEDNAKKIYGVQFHPEVVHTVNGMKVLSNFLFNA